MMLEFVLLNTLDSIYLKLQQDIRITNRIRGQEELVKLLGEPRMLEQMPIQTRLVVTKTQVTHQAATTLTSEGSLQTSL